MSKWFNLIKRQGLRSVSEEQLTISWLVKHVPASWFLSGIFMLSASFALGFQVKSELLANTTAPTADEVIQLSEQKSVLESEITVLKHQISALRIEKEVAQMSEDEVQQSLLKYARDGDESQ
ncbi:MULTISPECIES: hypothetical protein [Vibrio]|uniref:hypothetical protein n=1 Tax=Vibrio TaxID=662 RepID=UPI001BD455F3|nr:hypothetical protein [Vibrio alginolyticus]MBS9821130.1 hypothetical protein [Vibrio alginolyticus]